MKRYCGYVLHSYQYGEEDAADDIQNQHRSDSTLAKWIYDSISITHQPTPIWSSSLLLLRVSLSNTHVRKELIGADEDEADAVPAASVRDLPSMELEGIWEK